jgi:hypothetical protein
MLKDNFLSATNCFMAEIPQKLSSSAQAIERNHINI